MFRPSVRYCSLSQLFGGDSRRFDFACANKQVLIVSKPTVRREAVLASKAPISTDMFEYAGSAEFRSQDFPIKLNFDSTNDC